MRTLPLLAALSLALASLGGCAAEKGHFPSLAPRPIEKLGFAEPTVTPVVATADPALDARLAETAQRLGAIAHGFAGDAAKAEIAAAAAKGQAAGSERWIAAQSALASLDDWRAQASALLTDVEQLAIDRAATLAPDYPGIAALRDRAKAEADSEGATIARLSAALPQG
ncbi:MULTISPECIES: hypothetical protein [unclassified Sphingomonas]|uniref:hypothetical protein n=1 Tax=unclassified Sphingomonas TaxID=196159 RepID=UPI00226A42E1|nr:MULTISPECIES: hypothetical protein [unclassified Sphingomonas]